MAGEKILLVDDDETVRTIAKMCLEKGGFEVAMASSGEECLQMAENSMPRLILMDVFMPGLDGTATFQKLQENEALARVPVVFLTAKSSDQEIERLETMGAAGVLTKPFQPHQLSSQIEQFLLRRDDGNS